MTSSAASELLRLPDGKRPGLVVFDLDHTLLAGDSTTLWTKRLYKRGLVSDPRWLRLDEAMVKDYSAGTLDIRRYYREAELAVADLPAQKLQAEAALFAEEVLQPLAYPEGLAAAEACRREGIPAAILSASADFIVTEAAKIFGIERAMGMPLRRRPDGRVTGEIEGVPAFQEGKVERVRETLAELGLPRESLLFFTDSRNDIPLCRFAAGAYCVNPDAALLAEARAEGWRVLRWTRS